MSVFCFAYNSTMKPVVRETVFMPQMYKSSFPLGKVQFVGLVREGTGSKNLQVLHLNPSFPDVRTKKFPPFVLIGAVCLKC